MDLLQIINKPYIYQEIVIVKTLVLNILELSELNIYKKKQHYIVYYSAADNGFKSTIVNRALPSLHGEPLELTLSFIAV